MARKPGSQADLDSLVGELRSELQNGPDFERLTHLADEISEHADNAAQTFSSVNDALMSRLDEVTGRKKSSSGGQSREVAMLEKRIEKLYAQIAAMENALKTISNSKLYSNQQIQNLMRQLGLANEDKNYEKKREMLKIVMDVNKLIKKEGGELATVRRHRIVSVQAEGWAGRASGRGDSRSSSSRLVSARASRRNSCASR